MPWCLVSFAICSIVCAVGALRAHPRMPLRLLGCQRLLRGTLALIFALLALCSLGLALSLGRLAAW